MSGLLNQAALQEFQCLLNRVLRYINKEYMKKIEVCFSLPV